MSDPSTEHLVTLRDGSHVLIRPIRADQRNEPSQGMERLFGWVLGGDFEILGPLERIGASRKPDHRVLRIEVEDSPASRAVAQRSRRATRKVQA